MEIVLRQDFPALGYVGDRVNVRRGYARNFLIPRGIGVEIGSRSARTIGHLIAGVNAHKLRLKTQADELASRLAAVKLEFTLKIGGQGKSFGSVSLRDIEVALEQQGFKFDRRQLRLPEPIKGGGQFSVTVKLHSEVTVTLPISVTVERQQAKEVSEDGEPQRRRRSKGRSKDAAPEGESAANEPAPESTPE